VASDDELTALAWRFARFAEETRGRSALYTHLSLAIADDPAAASVLMAASAPQRRPNLLFAAVHDLLFAGAEHPLAAWYPSLGGDREPDAQTMAVFRDFLDAFHDDVAERVRSRTTQTNEPGRCAALRPALARLAGRTDRAVALVEVGASAGLLLHLDRYHYRYGDVEAGPASSPVRIGPDLRGPAPAELELPRIASRVGIDLRPLSPRDPDDARWVRACVWPEDVDRLARLETALDVAAAHDDVELVRGDMVSTLVPVVGQVDEDALVCVLHSTALAYLDEDGRSSIEGTLGELGAERDLARVSFEGAFVEPFATQERDLGLNSPGEVGCLLGLTVWIDGGRDDELLARAQPHGAWLEWVAGRAS
jgi:hypothetical protein